MDYGNNERSYNNRSYAGNRDGGENGGGGYRSNFSASERSVMQIPGTHIGKIIGPAGRHINDLQRQYNVRIQINKMANSDGTKDAEISGNNINDIQDAIKAINEQIDAPFERRGGGGGGSGFREGGGRGYNDRGNDREGGYSQGGNSYRGGDRYNSDRQSGGFRREDN